MHSTAPFWSLADLVSENAMPGELQVSLEDMISNTGRLVDGELSRYEANGTPFEAGDVLFGKLRPYLAKYWLADRPGTAGGDIHVYHPSKDVEPRFLNYIVGSRDFIRYAEAASKGVKMPRTEWMGLREFRVYHPDLPTQQRIADFLDRETGEIDAMVAKMDELAGTLESRRIESITSAVTGATSADRVQTGNVWFPTVPRGWRTSSVQLLSARLTDGAHISPETENGEYDFVSTRDVRYGVIDFEGSLKTSSSSYEYLVRTGCRPSDGDILFSKDGTVGETAIVEGTPEFVVASSLIIVTPTRSLVTPEFLRYALESGPAQRAARSYTRGSGLPRISVVNFGRGVVVPVPPMLEEQQRIADHLDEVTGKIDAMLAKVAELKSLLTERRAALITDVVTGRKDEA